MAQYLIPGVGFVDDTGVTGQQLIPGVGFADFGSGGGSANGTAPAATVTGTGSVTGGGASGSAAGTDATAPAATLTGTGSVAGGGASATASGSFSFDPCENNTQSGVLNGVAVNWAWHSGGAVGAATTVTNGSGTLNSTGMTISGLPVGPGYGVLRTTDGTVVAYQEGTVS